MFSVQSCAPDLRLSYQPTRLAGSVQYLGPRPSNLPGSRHGTVQHGYTVLCRMTQSKQRDNYASPAPDRLDGYGRIKPVDHKKNRIGQSSGMENLCQGIIEETPNIGAGVTERR